MGWQTGLSPFEGPVPATDWRPYDLHTLRDTYFAELRAYVQAAWSFGIVVQVSIFDAHGLRQIPSNPTAHGRWAESPYNLNNNLQPFLELDCTSCEYSTDFLGRDGTAAGAVNRSLVHRVVEELRGFGNVIYEVMNEPRPPLMVDDSAANVWQSWVADVIQEAYDNGPLTISLHPSDRSVSAHDPVSFSCGATGGARTSPYEYRWQFNATSSGAHWTDLSDDPRWTGEDRPHFELHNAAPEHDGFRLRCIVRDLRHPADGGEVISNSATLTVTAAN